MFCRRAPKLKRALLAQNTTTRTQNRNRDHPNNLTPPEIAATYRSTHVWYATTHASPEAPRAGGLGHERRDTAGCVCRHTD